jgi:hypothetical protein
MLAQAYRWTLEDISKMSYTQIIMLQHAAGHNRKLLDARLEEGKKKGNMTATEELAEYGKPLQELSSEDLAIMASRDGSRPKFIDTKKAAKDGSEEQED